MNTVTTAIISGGSSIVVGLLALIGVIISGGRTNREVRARLETSQAVTDTKLDELTREVRSHNDFARRIPVIEEKIKVINHRVEDLENKM